MNCGETIREKMERIGAGVVIPTYNNAATVAAVVAGALEQSPCVIVVDDGSTDSTAAELARFGGAIELVSCNPNRGKGCALREGFRRARELGLRYAVTLDSDGQHYPEDIGRFAAAAEKYPDMLLLGSRGLEHANMPRGNTFANRFSNFWFAVQTFRRLPDTQTGYRLYPLRRMAGMRFFTSRYEAELEMLVRAVWAGIGVAPIPVRVYYAPEGERVSHFRKGRDFARISLLNTLLCMAAVVYGWPSMLFHRIFGRR